MSDVSFNGLCVQKESKITEISGWIISDWLFSSYAAQLTTCYYSHGWTGSTRQTIKIQKEYKRAKINTGHVGKARPW